MPPKKAGKASKGGRNRGKEEEAPKDVIVPPSDKEILLKEELESIVKELDESRGRILELKIENDWLQEEANKIRLENHEYLSYMEKKTSKRQMAIVSLSDYNEKQIQDLQLEQKEMIAQFEKQKEELNSRLLEKESVLAKINQELDGMKEFKLMQQEQLRHIHELEREIMTLRGRHTDTIQQLKKAFLREKHDCQSNADRKIAEMSKQANQEAVTCLNIHSQRVRAENRSLRHELLALIRKSQALREHERRLLEQRRVLRAERQYAADLGRLRAERKMRADPAIAAEAAAADWPAIDCATDELGEAD